MSKKDWETDGMRNGQPIYCPTNAYDDCPYCDKRGICHINDPIEECDDFMSFFESWEDWDAADEVDDDAPLSFVEAEIEWAREKYGYKDERG